MQETVEEIWAMSYSVIGGIISANTALVLEVSPLRKGRVDGSTQEQNRWLKTASGKAITGNCTAPEEKGVLHIAHDGSGKSPSESGYQESHSTEWT